MVRIFSVLIAGLMLFAYTDTLAQGNSQGKGKAHQKVAVCHNGNIINVNVASLDAHLNHGDALAVQNANGEWVCPGTCEEPTTEMLEPRQCPDGTLIRPEWDPDLCEWVYPECPSTTNER